jgi:hypothetical protein
LREPAATPAILRAAAPTRPPPTLGRALGLAAILQVALFFWFLPRTMILRPFADMFAWIGFYLAFLRSGALWTYLWAPHNEHHLVLIRLLTAVDVAWFHAGGLPFVVAATAAQLACALLVLGELRREPALRGPLRPLSWLGPMLLLTTAAVVDCSIPINAVYPLALVFVILSLVLFDGEAERSPATPARRCGAVAAAAAAALGNAIGLVAWPVLLWSAWRGRAGWRWLAAIAAIALLYGGFYLHDLPAHPPPPGAWAPAHLRKLAEYLVAYLGLPIARSPTFAQAGRVIGALLLLAGLAAALWWGLLRRAGTRLDRIAIGLILLTLGTAALAAVGRVDLEQEVAVPLRYSVLVAPLHVGLLALALPRIAGWATDARLRSVALGAGLLLAVLLIAQQILLGRAEAAGSRIIAATIERYYAGIREPGMVPLVYPDLAVPDAVLTELRRAGGG